MIKATLADINTFINEDELFPLSSLTRACRLPNDILIHKLPLYKGMVKIILATAKNLMERNNQAYLSILYQAMFATGYYELFGVGELTIGESDQVILARNVHIALNKKKLLFLLSSSKTHMKGNQPQIVKISTVQNAVTKVMFCPFELLWEYLRWRPNSVREDEPFFVFQNNTVVSGTHFREMLK